LLAVERKAIYAKVHLQAIGGKELAIALLIGDFIVLIMGMLSGVGPIGNRQSTIGNGRSVKFLAKLELQTPSEAYLARRFPTLAHQW
jgi:hypothetical protein